MRPRDVVTFLKLEVGVGYDEGPTVKTYKSPKLGGPKPPTPLGDGLQFAYKPRSAWVKLMYGSTVEYCRNR